MQLATDTTSNWTGVNLVAPPAVEPVHLDVVKRHAIVDDTFSEDDGYLMDLIAAAREPSRNGPARLAWSGRWKRSAIVSRRGASRIRGGRWPASTR